MVISTTRYEPYLSKANAESFRQLPIHKWRGLAFRSTVTWFTEQGDEHRCSSPLPASAIQFGISAGVHSRGCRGTVSEPDPLSALHGTRQGFKSVPRRQCFMFQCGIDTTMSSCDIFDTLVGAN